MEAESDLKPILVIEELNQQWMERMLSLKFRTSVSIKSWKYSLPETLEGFMSEIAYVKVTFTMEGQQETELQLVVKVLPKEDMRKKTMAEGGLDIREVKFYNLVNSDEFQNLCCKKGITIQVPKVYYASYLKGDVTLVMEDLNVSKYKVRLVKDGSSLSHTKVALKAVAQFHAAGLAYIKEHGESTIPTIAEEFKLTCFDWAFIRNLKFLADLYVGTPLSEAMKSLLPYTADILMMRRRYPLLRTVVHGDYWAGQLMFSEDESQVMMIDWQHCHVDTPSSDILSMLFMSCHPKILEDHLEEILEWYWKVFTDTACELGVSVEVTFEQFKKNINDLMLYGFMMVGISIPEFLGNSMSDERLQGYIKFLVEKGIVSDYVNMMENERTKS